MTRLPLRIIAIAAAFLLLSAGDCEIGDFALGLDKPGRIVVTNVGADPAVLAILADDVKSYPTLAAGQTASVQTNVGGVYQIRVLLAPENALNYRADLQVLRSNVEKLIDGSISSDEKTRLFVKLAGIKAALAAMDQGTSAGCSGHVQLNAENAETVNSTVAWVTQSGTGFWDATCGSN